MLNIEYQVDRMAEAIPAGSVIRDVCPACGGGETKERTFIVGRESSRVWWKCFRASCNTSGIVGAAHLPVSLAQEATRALARIRVYDRPTLPLSVPDQQYFQDRFEVHAHRHVFVTTNDEYAMPIRQPYGGIRGYVIRQPVWKGEPRPPRKGRAGYYDDAGVWQGMPKTILYAHTIEPMLAWYWPPRAAEIDTPNGDVVLVEDQVSAMKVAQHCGVWAVALLGNGLNLEQTRELYKFKPKRVTIALDPGAEGQAQHIAKKWGLYFEKTRVVLLDADPKDIPADELAGELNLGC